MLNLRLIVIKVDYNFMMVHVQQTLNELQWTTIFVVLDSWEDWGISTNQRDVIIGLPSRVV